MSSQWSPFYELTALRNGIDELFGSFLGSGPLNRAAFLPGRSARGYPRLNIASEGDKIVVDALAPGLDIDSLDVSYAAGVLTIAGEKKPLPRIDREAYHRNERASGKFVRTVRLEIDIDPDAIEASYENGILSVCLPKAPSVVPKRIDVQKK